MDVDKRDQLIARLSGQAEPLLVPIDEFFDGNDDPGSIGCNLVHHPGIKVFRDVLVGISRHADVDAVFAQISEVDPGPGSWPFSDLVLVVGTISRRELAQAVSVLQPDKIGAAEAFGVSGASFGQDDPAVTAMWWD